MEIVLDIIQFLRCTLHTQYLNESVGSCGMPLASVKALSGSNLDWNTSYLD